MNTKMLMVTDMAPFVHMRERKLFGGGVKGFDEDAIKAAQLKRDRKNAKRKKERQL